MMSRLLFVLVVLCAGCAMVNAEAEPARTSHKPRSAGAPSAPARPLPTHSAEPVVALWVTRWDFKTQEDVDQIMQRAASLGVTDVLWQVRGQADAYYPSSLEPWGEDICTPGPGGRLLPPGFDPLRAAVDSAHARGLRLHAWMNVMPMWKGTQPPRAQGHMYYRHPDWIVRDASNEPQALNEHYVTVNFTLPAVQDHIAAVALDIVTRYPVDGLHFDYVRFVNETANKSLRLMEDPGTLDRYAKEQGVRLTDRELPEHRAQIAAWRRGKITGLVRRIARECRVARPGLVISGAVWRTPKTALGFDQEAAQWLNEGTLDRAYPMIYCEKDDQFARELGEWVVACPGKAVTPGIGVYLHAPSRSAAQFSTARRQAPSGLGIFAYASLFESPDPRQDKKPGAVRERAERLAGIRALLVPKPAP